MPHYCKEASISLLFSLTSSLPGAIGQESPQDEANAKCLPKGFDDSFLPQQCPEWNQFLFLLNE